MIPDKAISKYLKVKTMAERGEEGERKAAAGILLMLNKKYPGIGTVAAERQEEEKRADSSPGEAQDTPPGVWSKGGAPNARRDGDNGNWENIFQNGFEYAKTAWQGVYGFASSVNDIIMARNLGIENVQLVAKENPTGSISINVRIPSEVVDLVDGHLSVAQRSAFRDAVLERFQEALDVAVWGSSEG